MQPPKARAFDGLRDVSTQRDKASTVIAFTAIHNRVIDLGDGSEATLAICPDMYGNLAIFAVAEVMQDTDGGGPQRAAGWILKTDLHVADYCEPGIATLERVAFIGDFEMTPELKLARLPSSTI
jgi:hypothetical protein